MKSLLFVFRFGFPYLRKYWTRFAIGIAFGVLFGVTNAGFVWATKTIFDRLSPAAPSSVALSTSAQAGGWKDKLVVTQKFLSKKLDSWLPLYQRKVDWKQALGALLLLPFFMAVRGATGYINSYCMIWVSERVTKDIRLGALKKLNSLSLDYFDRASSGDLITRTNEDSISVQRCLSLGLADLVKEPVTIISVFAALYLLDWQLAVFSLVFLPLCIVPMGVLARKVRRSSRETIKAHVSQSSLMIELLAGIRIVKAFGLEKMQEARFEKYVGHIAHHSVKATKSKEMVNPIIETISMVGLGVIIVYVCWTGRSAGDLVAFLTALALFFSPVKKLAALNMMFNQTRIGVERLQQLFTEQPSVKEPAHPVRKSDFSEAISLENVCFAYGIKPVLNDISLRIRRGCRLGVAGESGSGKSTLVNLLFRFYDPTNGAIRLDGVDLRQMATGDLRHLMALVSQNTVLFDQTVAENIACGKLGASRSEIEAAARAANAHEFIVQLPLGYDARIGEQGVTLSGGQRQRLAIARAFVRNAPILVLDEATAALDSHAEMEVQAAIDRLSEERTVICVAHRLATLRGCDEIIVLSEGRIIERGRFEELMQKNGAFAAMARKQGL
ncbi:MAG: ABC transporter ATP-binding protein [bacterium]